MKYKVVPFIASLNQKNTSAEAAAEQLESMITRHATLGWQYIRLESVTTVILPESGCFGLSTKPGYTTVKQLLVFEKNESE